MDQGAIARLVREIDGPLNVLGARAGMASALSIADLERLGVKRVSIGGSLSAAVLGFVRQSMRELREAGTFGYTQQAPSNAHLNAVMDKYRSR
jgi:2-methylisocitrate lyase-like PEP mutase family enzyme